MKRNWTGASVSSSPEQTLLLGSELASLLRPGEVVALYGALGTGKTVFVRGIARGLGLAEESVTSPTFSIIQEYGGSPPLFHVDLYRLSGEREAAELGLEEYFDSTGVTVVEWAERAEGMLPALKVSVDFERLGPRRRRLTLRLPP